MAILSRLVLATLVASLALPALAETPTSPAAPSASVSGPTAGQAPIVKHRRHVTQAHPAKATAAAAKIAEPAAATPATMTH